MDKHTNEPSATPSIKDKLRKKKTLPTVSPTASVNETKNKRTTRASLPLLPVAAAVSPSTPSQQPPKKKRKTLDTPRPQANTPVDTPHQQANAPDDTPHEQSGAPVDTPQKQANAPVWPSLEPYAKLTPQEILDRFSNPGAKLIPQPNTRAGKRSRIDKPDAQPPPDQSLGISSSSQQASGQTIVNPQEESSQLQSSQVFPLENNVNAQLSIPGLQTAGTTSKSNSQTATKSAKSRVNSSRDSPATGPECLQSHSDNQAQSQTLNNAEKDGPQVPQAKRTRRKSARHSVGQADQSNATPEALSMAPSSPSHVSQPAGVHHQKTNDPVGKTPALITIPLTGRNLLQATSSHTLGVSTSVNRPAHQAALPHATAAVPAQDRENDCKSDHQTETGDTEQHSLNIPDKLALHALKKEKSKTKAKQRKLQKKQSLRSGSVSTTQTLQEARCLSSLSASPRPREMDFHILSRQSTPASVLTASLLNPASMLNVPKHFGRWELSIPSDREVPVALLARMHHLLDEAVCAGFAKPIFRDPTPAIAESLPPRITSPHKDCVSSANPPEHLTELPNIQPPPDKTTPANPAPIPKLSFPSETTDLADVSPPPSIASAPKQSVSADKTPKRLTKLPKIQPSTAVPYANSSTNPAAKRLPPSETTKLADVTPGLVPAGRAVKHTLSNCSSSLSDDINNTVSMTLGLEDICQYDYETYPHDQQTSKGPATDSNQKLIDTPRGLLKKDVVSASTPAVSSINPWDEAPSNKLPAPSLPPSSTSPTPNNSKTQKVSQPGSSDMDESDSSDGDRAPPSAQRPRKSVSSESSSSGDDSSSTTGSHAASSPAKPPPSQLSPIPTSQFGVAGLYERRPVTNRRKTLDAFRPLDFTSNPPKSIDHSLPSPPAKHAGHSEKDSSSTSDDDDSDSDSGESGDGRPKKKAADRPVGLPAHKLAGSSKPAALSSSQKRGKPKKSIFELWEKEEAKISKSKKKS